MTEVLSVIQKARAEGLGKKLGEPLDVLYDVPKIGERATELLDFIFGLSPTARIEELVTERRIVEFVRRRASPQQREELAAALAAYLESGARKAPEVDIEMWAAAHSVSDCLDAPLRILDDLVPWQHRPVLFGPGKLTLRHLFTPGFAANSKVPGATRALPALQKAARRHLEAIARGRRDALAEEAELLALPPPEDPVARELFDRLREVRADIRKTVVPRALHDLPPAQAEIDPEVPALLAREAGWPRHSVEVPLQARGPSELLAVTCSCTPVKPAACAAVLTAIDALLSILGDTRRKKQRGELIAVVGKPVWARTLADLDGLLSSAPAVDEARIVWRVSNLADGRVSVTPALQRPAKGKGLTRGSRMRIAELARAMPQGALPADREAMALLRFDNGANTSRALLALVGHPRVTLAQAPFEPVTVKTGALVLEAADESGGGLTLRATVDGCAIDPASLAKLDATDDLQPILDEERRVLTMARIPPAARAVLGVLGRRGGYFPAEAVPSLVERLPAIAERAALRLPPSLRGEAVAREERLLIRLEPQGEGLRVRALLRPLAEGAAQVPGEGAAEIVGWREGRRVHAARELRSEEGRARAALVRLPLPAEAEVEPFAWALDDEAALDLVAALRDAGEDFLVEWDGQARHVTRTATPADLRIRVFDRHDWFGLSGQVSVDGACLPLADLLDAIRARRRYVKVTGGVWLRIGDELRARLEPASDHVAHGKQGVELSPLAAPALADLVEEASARFHEVVARLRAAQSWAPAPPEELRGALRDYQVIGYQWLSRLASWGIGGCLADDMGLGKTVQALALLSERAALGPALVVAPTSVGWNWVREARRFTPGLRPILYREVDRQQALATLGPGDVLVTSYGLLARTVEDLAPVRFATLILDEAQVVKNPATQRARAATALTADFRVALTGTPVENRLAELWSLFRVIAPGLLGSWERFRERFAAPIEKDRDPHRQAALARLVRPFILRRLKSEVARELPPRTEIREEITLSPEERELYEALRRSVLAELAAPAPRVKAEQRRFQVLAAITRLRQLACHPRLIDDRSPVTSAKLERCLELIDELTDGGHRALVFSQFTSHLALLREALDAAEGGASYLYLDGQTPPGKRQELCDAFQRGEGDVFLISLKAGGTGLNLTGADYVIHLDPWWNPAVEDQATDRAHRIGQDKPVTVYRLVARETIEESIVALHDEKRRLVAGILDGTGGAAGVTTEELMDLLRDR